VRYVTGTGRSCSTPNGEKLNDFDVFQTIAWHSSILGLGGHADRDEQAQKRFDEGEAEGRRQASGGGKFTLEDFLESWQASPQGWARSPAC